MSVNDGLQPNLESIEKKKTENKVENIENEVTSNQKMSEIETNNNNAEQITEPTDGLYIILFFY